MHIGRRNHNLLFAEEETSSEVGVAENARKGRNPEMLEKRNKHLVARYYYYGQIQKLLYDVVMEKLSQEFYLTPGTVPQVLSELGTELAELRRTAPSAASFAKQWPWMKWQQ